MLAHTKGSKSIFEIAAPHNREELMQPWEQVWWECRVGAMIKGHKGYSPREFVVIFHQGDTVLAKNLFDGTVLCRRYNASGLVDATCRMPEKMAYQYLEVQRRLPPDEAPQD